jgi:hypothetical protein
MSNFFASENDRRFDVGLFPSLPLFGASRCFFIKHRQPFGCFLNDRFLGNSLIG